MQFTYEHYIGETFHRFHANFNGIKPIALHNLKDSFNKLGGQEDREKAWWYFPLHITSEVLQEVIHNTCFVCGGLMKDDTKEIETREGKRTDIYFVTIRKCSSCGHSHT